MPEERKMRLGPAILLGAAAAGGAILLGKQVVEAREGDLEEMDYTPYFDAMLQAMNNQSAVLQSLIDNLSIRGYPPNLPTIWVGTIPIMVANTPYRGPEWPIEDGYALVIKSAPGNAGIILVGPSPADSVNANSAYQLARNETIAYYITNASQLWVSGNAVNDVVIFTVEKRS